MVIGLAPSSARVAATMVLTMIELAVLGDVGARLGGAPRGRAALRVLVTGALALVISLGIGKLTGTVV